MGHSSWIKMLYFQVIEILVKDIGIKKKDSKAKAQR